MVALVWAACAERENAPEDAAPTADASVDAAPGSSRVRLIDHFGWEHYEAQADPLFSHQPLELRCPESAAFVEFDAFEVDTTRCNYLLAQHGSLAALPAGATVELSLLHYDLLAPEPSEAHIAILFGDDLQWETNIPIPASGRAIDARFVTTRALALDEPIRLHLHNHGANTYLLYGLEAVGL